MLVFRSRTSSTVHVREMDGLEGGVADGRPDLELELRHGPSRGAIASQTECRVEGACGIEVLAIIVPPRSSSY